MTKWKNIKKNANGLYEGVIYRYFIDNVNIDLNGWGYVGKTADEVNRRKSFNGNQYSGKKFNDAIKTLGRAAFSYEVIETVFAATLEELEKILNELETYYIRLYNYVEKGFNSSYGNGNKGIPLTETHKRKIAEGNRKYGVIATDKYTGVSMQFESVNEASEVLGITPSSLRYYLGKETEQYEFKAA